MQDAASGPACDAPLTRSGWQRSVGNGRGSRGVRFGPVAARQSDRCQVTSWWRTPRSAGRTPSRSGSPGCHLAVAGADGMPAGRLVQLRRSRQRRCPERGPDPPQFQQVQVGDILPQTPTAEDRFVVRAVEPERALVLGDAAGSMSWAFVLEPVGETSTRLITRSRGAYDRVTFGLLPSSSGTRSISGCSAASYSTSSDWWNRSGERAE